MILPGTGKVITMRIQRWDRIGPEFKCSPTQLNPRLKNGKLGDGRLRQPAEWSDIV